MSIPHTSRMYDRELSGLRERLLAMGGRAEQQIVRAMASITHRDARLAERVIADDERIDRDEIEIDERAFLVLAKRQPLASDLRFIMLALKTVTDLERIADLASGIAEQARELFELGDDPLPPELFELGERVHTAVRNALDAFVEADPVTAENVIRDDTDIDHLNMQLIGALLAQENRTRADNERLLVISSISRCLERIGDHATNVAEMVIYYVRGRDVRHHPPPARG
jgi:phosphate transport system protein